MFRLVVREHIMIAHSFQGEIFGPAQELHGATFVVDLELSRPTLDENGIVCDIGLLSELLASVLKPLNYQNLDELPQFEGQQHHHRSAWLEHITHEVAKAHPRWRARGRSQGGDGGDQGDARRIPRRLGQLRDVARTADDRGSCTGSSRARLHQRTGGYIYDRRIVDGLRSPGARMVEVYELPKADFPDVGRARP